MAAREVRKQQQQQVALLHTMGESTNAIALRLGLGQEQVARWLKSPELANLISTMRSDASPRLVTLYHLVIDSCIMDLDKAKTLADRQNVRAEALRLLAVGDLPRQEVSAGPTAAINVDLLAAKFSQVFAPTPTAQVIE
jgi:hypothetical protein